LFFEYELLFLQSKKNILMNLKGILAISGQAGLFRHIKDVRNAIIVESLDNGKRMPVMAASKVSALEDIAIYTDGEDILLKELFKNIFVKENGGAAPTHKNSGNSLLEYFGQVLPNFDRQRVYQSDVKRLIQWYNILQKLGLLSLEDDTQNETENPETEEVVETANETAEA